MPIQKWSDTIWVAQLSGNPGFAEDVDYLQKHAAENGSTPDVVLDLSGVDHLNSSDLSRLLRLRKHMIDTEARLLLAGPSDTIWALFLATALDKVFDFAADTTTALAELQIDG